MALRGAVCKNVSIFTNSRRPRIRFPVFAVPSSPTTSNRSPSQGNCFIAMILLKFGFVCYVFVASRHGIRALNNQAVAESKTIVKEDESSQNWRIKMLYDGECPLCMREVNMLRERNKLHGAIKFVDISSDEYTPEENQGLDYETVMGRIHAILSDGTVVTDIEAFRRLYEEVGLGWVYAVTKYEPIATIANAVYALWAKYRLQITDANQRVTTLVLGRPPLEEVLEARRKNWGEVCKTSKSCDI